MELAEIFKNSIPVDAIAPSPDGDNIANADDVIAENHLTPNPPIADTLENIVPSPSPAIQITIDFPRVNSQSLRALLVYQGWLLLVLRVHTLIVFQERPLLQPTRIKLLIPIFVEEKQRKNHYSCLIPSSSSRSSR